MKKLILALLLLVSCTAQKVAVDKPAPVSPGCFNPFVNIAGKIECAPRARKVPVFKCVDCVFGTRYIKALELLNTYANTDEFEAHLLKKRLKFSHVGDKSPQIVVKAFRAQLDLGEEIPVTFYWNPFTKGIGAWDVDKIKQNTKFSLAPKQLAAHLLHETSHKYGWKHLGNSKADADNANSFPYAVGDEFEAFLTEKGL